MTKLGFSVIAAAGVVCVVTILARQQQSKLRGENSLLRRQIEQLASLRSENESLSNQLVQANNASTISSAQISELLRLRSEVGGLRREANKVGKLQDENLRLRSSMLQSNAGAQTSPPMEKLPKESWAFVGYSNPESAFQSAVWAMSQGDANAFRTSLASEGEEFAKSKDTPDADLSTQIKGEADRVTAFKIINKEATSADTTVLTVMAEGANGVEVRGFKMQRIGEDWKFVGAVNWDAAPKTK